MIVSLDDTVHSRGTKMNKLPIKPV